MRTLSDLELIRHIDSNGISALPWARVNGVLLKIQPMKNVGEFKVIINHQLKQYKCRWTRPNRVISNSGHTVILVRDGFYLNKKSQNIALRNPMVHQICRYLGIKRRIGAKNLGVLYAKYNIPKAARKIMQANYILEYCLAYNNIRKIVPIPEYIIEILKSSGTRFHDPKFFDTYKILLAASEYRRKKYLEYTHIRDIVRMINIMLGIKPDYKIDFSLSPEQMHNSLSKEINRIKTANIAVNYGPKILELFDEFNEALKNCGANNISLRLVKDTHELVNWGIDMDHCIGSYRDAAISMLYLFFGVFIDGKLTYTIQSSKFTETTDYSKSLKIIQFFGYRNSYPKDDHKKIIRHVVEKRNL